MFAKYGSSGTPSTPDNLAAWAASSSGTTAGSVIGTDLGSSTLNNWVPSSSGKHNGVN